MKEIVINRCFGGFGLSYNGTMAYAKRKGMSIYAYVDARDQKGNRDVYEPYDGKGTTPFIIYYTTQPLKDGKFNNSTYFSDRDIPRDDPCLIETVKSLGKTANGSYADLKIVSVPDEADWEIEEYDGNEWVSEKHTRWS